MDKLKKVFSPGSKKDDEVLYGDTEARRASAVENTSSQQPEQLHPVEGSSKKEGGGVMSQILNPGGDKYDEERFGTTATTEAPVKETDKLYTHPEAEKDNTILRQIVNPNNAKYDETRFGETAATGGDGRKASIPAVEAPATVGPDVQLETKPGKKDHSILRQILNPHGDKYDEQGYGSTARAVDEKDVQASRSDPVANPDSSIKRQILNPGGEKYDPVIHGGSGTNAGTTDTSTIAPSSGAGSTQQTLPDRTAPTTTTTTNTTTTTSSQPLSQSSAVPSQQAPVDQTNYGRDAAIAGGGLAAAGGAGYYAANRDNADDKITDRPHPSTERAGDVPVAGSTTQGGYTGTDSTLASTQGGYAGTGSTATNPHSVGPAGGAHINPVGAPEESLTSGQSSYLDRDTLVGAGAGGITGAAASTQINHAPSDVQDATYTERSAPVGGGYHHTTGPHQTDIANILDPHVPGEFPTEDGTDKHGLNNPPLGPIVAKDGPESTTGTSTTGTSAVGNSATGTSATGTSATDRLTSDPAATSTTTEEKPSEKKGIVGSIASAVGFGGLVGGGAAATKDHSEKTVEPTQTTSTQSTSDTTHPGGASYPIQTTTNTIPSGSAGAQGTSGSSITEPSSEHHYGRDAGIAAGAAGAGAAGYGAYEATRDRSAADPSTATSSTVPSTNQHTAPTTTTTNTASSTTVPETSTTGRIAEPAKDEHHYGRDAAIVGGAGGAGAAGYGAYEASKDRDAVNPATTTSLSTIQPTQQNAPLTSSGGRTSTSTTTATHVPTTAAATEPTKDEHHYGRDAAIAGGAGAASVGAYEATKPQAPPTGSLDHPLVTAQDLGIDNSAQSRTDTGPASKTIGPHDSNIANIVDPRVQPDVTKQGSKTADPTKDEHHYGRDAAIAGGAGVAGVGALEATKSHEPPAVAAQKAREEETRRLAAQAQQPTQKDQPMSSSHHDKKEKKHHHDEEKDEKEKKPSLIHRILHPGESKKEKEEEKEVRKSSDQTRKSYEAPPPGSLNHPLVTSEDLGIDNRVSTDEKGHNRLHKKSVEQPHVGQQQDERVIEPHTGLPMNVGKYGTGEGGTDGAQNITGYHETDPAMRGASVGTAQTGANPGEEGVAGPDWQAIKKSNTPY